MFSASQIKEYQEKKHLSGLNQASLDVIIPDMLGILRGKRLGSSEVENFFKSGLRAPRSIYLYDSVGDVCTNMPYAISDGDPDFAVYGHESTLRTGVSNGMMQIFGYMLDDKGEVMDFDSRYQLKKMIDRFAGIGIEMKVGLEIEFYLLEENHGSYEPLIKNPYANSISDLDQMSSFIDELNSISEEQKIGVQTIISETGGGQFEVSLSVENDLLLACDKLLILKRIIAKKAQDHGYIGCFMAKPREKASGSGLHLHVSFYDKKTNKNVLAGNLLPELGTPCSENTLYMINGLLETMNEFMAIFAPNANSYRRFKTGSFAPTNKAWGANNRSTAVRLPKANDESARIEHRLAGADANCYLTLAAILAGAFYGLEKKKKPPSFVTGDAYKDASIDKVPSYWSVALSEFAKSKITPEYFSETFHFAYLKNREYECSKFHSQVLNEDFNWYLRSI